MIGREQDAGAPRAACRDDIAQMLEPLTLTIARSGADLLPAIEAAAFARIVQIDDDARAGPATAVIERFVALIEVCAEGQAAGPGPARPQLSGLLQELEGQGLFVHSATTALALGSDQAVRLPVAVLTVGRSDTPTRTVLVPPRAEPATWPAATRH